MPKDDRLVNGSHTRRDFLATAAAATGAAAFLSACSTLRKDASDAQAAMFRTPLADTEPVRMAVIGTGGMGTAHCDAFISLAQQDRADVEVIALADVCQPRLQHAQGKCERTQGRTVAAYRDYRELLARDDVHGVLIASPEHWHAQMAIDAIVAGKDVYLEKPMTLTLDDALRLRAVVLSNPETVFQVGTQMIMLPKYHAARKLIRDGTIGKPIFSQTSYCRNTPDGEWLYYDIDSSWDPRTNLDWDAWCGPLGARPWDPEVYARWRRYRDFSTGIVGDLLVHVMTPLVLATDMGWPTRVVASGGHYVDTAMENHDQVNINIEFEDGHTMVVAGSTANEVGLETLIRGHMANLYLGSRHCVVRPERVFVDDVDAETIQCEDIGNDQDQLRLNWLQCIRSRQTPDSGVELGTKIMVIVDLATRSMWDGHAYAFDPTTMRATRI